MIVLSKESSGIDLRKDGDTYGEVAINLNWDSAPVKGGLFGGLFGKAKAIDLDLGCLFELKNGDKGAVQALGNVFGDLKKAPFIALDGDDRTGENADGEWLRINGAKWNDIQRVLIYTFIYDGVPNWSQTNGRVTFQAPGAESVEVRMDDGHNGRSMCAIATLVNDKGRIRVEREVKYFRDHQDMDLHYGWGLRWQAGSKD